MIQVLRETKEAPADIQARIARVGGRNLYGQPNFRVIWGWNRLDEDGRPRYPFAELNRWYLERWIAPEACGVRGGDYEMCDDGGLLGARLPETGAIERFLIPLIERSRGISFRERRAALRDREERGEQEFERRAYDILDDAGPAFRGAAASGPAGPVKSFLEKTEEKWIRRASCNREYQQLAGRGSGINGRDIPTHLL